jgi:hypothetical protein
LPPTITEIPPTLVSPFTPLLPARDEIVATRYPVFVWTAHESATAYRLVVLRRSAKNPRLDLRLDAAQICSEGLCAVDAGLIAPPRPLGEGAQFTWWAVAITPDGRIPSARTPFRVAAPENIRPTFTPAPSETPYGQPPENIAPLGFDSPQATLPTVQVTANSAGAIRTAIAISNQTANCGKNYVIVLESGKTYSITSPAAISTATFNQYGNTAFQPIRCNVTIRGGTAVLARSTGTAVPNFRIFTVAENGYLRLENVTVQNGRATKWGGGGIWNDRGELEVYRSTIRDNRVNIPGEGAQILGGGIYSYYGGLSVIESVITNNWANTTNSDGGGIGVIAKKTDVGIVIRGNDIRGNRALRNGNGVYVQDTFADVSDNCFVGNRHPNPTPTLTSNVSVQSPNNVLNVRDSWWGSSSGPALNVTAAATRDSLRGTATYLPFDSAQPAQCNRLPPATLTPTATRTSTATSTATRTATATSTATRTATATATRTATPTALVCTLGLRNCPTPTATPPTLASYGVATTNCDQNEINAVFAGTQATGLTLQLTFGGGSAWDTFRRVMYTPGRSGIRFDCDANAGVVCETENFPPAPNAGLQAVIRCGSQVQLSQYTVVHEYGHVFTGRMGGLVEGSTYFGLISQPQVTLAPPAPAGTLGPLFDDAQNIVFGPFLAGVNLDPDWTRGGRGWGSPASTPPAVPCNFQQNAFTVNDWQVTPTRTPPAIQTERDEAAADMFLNWVYRVQNLGGFRNEDQRNISDCAFVAPTDTGNPGDARYRYMQTIVMPTLVTRVPTPTATP